MGFIIAFAYSFYLCANVKLYILTSMLVVGMLGYFAVEYLHWKETHAKSDTHVSPLSSKQSNGLPESGLRYPFVFINAAP